MIFIFLLAGIILIAIVILAGTWGNKRRKRAAVTQSPEVKTSAAHENAKINRAVGPEN